MPKPANMWPKKDQHILLGLFFVFSIAWALEQCVVFDLTRPYLTTYLVKSHPF